MNLLSELKRRNVFRVALFYIVAAWVVVQVAETVLPVFEVPDSMLRGLVILLALGFVPAVVLAWVFEWTPDGIRRESDLDADHGVRRKTANKLNWATLIVALLAIGLLLADRLLPEPGPTAQLQSDSTADDKADNGAATESRAGGVAGIADASIAVLPFADLSPEGDQAYFSDGIAEEILNVLVRVDGLEVASRTSSFGFKGRESLGIPAIAETLKVRHILEGSVRRAGDSVRVTAQLIDAATDRHLWSDTFDRPLSAENLFAIQDEVASAIVEALVSSLGLNAIVAVPLERSTENLDAYDLFLKARALFQGRREFQRADALLEAALAGDPSFAKAWELRAALNSLMREYAASDIAAEAQDQRVSEFAERALALDPNSDMAIAVLARVRSEANRNLRARHDIAAILADFERALAINPHNASTHNWLGIELAVVGRGEDALARFERCVEIDPGFGPCSENTYELLLGLGREAQALERFERALGTGAVTGQYVNFTLLAQAGNQTAFTLATNMTDWLPGWRRHDEIYAAYRRPERDHGALVKDIRDFVAANDLKPYYLGNLLVPLGAHDMRPFWPLIWGPDYARYRQSPQFSDFIRRSGVLDYWQAHGWPKQCRPLGEEDFECS
jgi:TolB-like protein/Tfp pilus assembly protein PilF